MTANSLIAHALRALPLLVQAQLTGIVTCPERQVVRKGLTSSFFGDLI